MGRESPDRLGAAVTLLEALMSFILTPQERWPHIDTGLDMLWFDPSQVVRLHREI